MPAVRNTSDGYLNNKYIWKYACQKKKRLRELYRPPYLYCCCFLSLEFAIIIINIYLCVLFEFQLIFTDVLLLMAKIMITEMVIKTHGNPVPS